MRPFPLPNPYPNLLANASATAAAVAQCVAGYPLTFLPTKDQEVEWGVAWPSFVYTFYDHLNPIPTQAEFWAHYLADHAPFFQQRPLTAATQLALQARIYRTYPSLVRDWHFALFLHELTAVAKSNTATPPLAMWRM